MVFQYQGVFWNLREQSYKFHVKVRPHYSPRKGSKLSPKLGRAVFFPHKMSKTWKFSVFYLEIKQSHGNKKCSPSKIGRGGSRKNLWKWFLSPPNIPWRLGGRIKQILNFKALAASKRLLQLAWNFAWPPHSSVWCRKSSEEVNPITFNFLFAAYYDSIRYIDIFFKNPIQTYQ